MLRRLIRYGLDPLQAIRCATINNAIRLRREDLGLVAAGRRADLVALSDLNEVTVEAVYSNGRHVAQGGKMIVPLAAVEPPLENTMKVAPLQRRRFPHPGAGRHQRPRTAPDHQGRALQFLERDRGRGPRRICRGSAKSQRDGDRAPARPQRSEAALAVIEGWDRWGGAFATSYSHDSHNLILYGHDAAELALAANTVIGMRAGSWW